MYFEPADESLFALYQLDKEVINKLATDIINHVNEISLQLFEHADL